MYHINIVQYRRIASKLSCPWRPTTVGRPRRPGGQRGHSSIEARFCQQSRTQSGDYQIRGPISPLNKERTSSFRLKWWVHWLRLGGGPGGQSEQKGVCVTPNINRTPNTPTPQNATQRNIGLDPGSPRGPGRSLPFHKCASAQVKHFRFHHFLIP